MSISILLADDHEIYCHGLQVLLSLQSDFNVVGQAADGVEAVKLAKRLHPDIVIVDMVMPGLNGVEVTSQIKQYLPNSRVIVLSMHDDESYVLDALQNGASGYILKGSSSADLVQAIYTVISGKRFLSPPLTERAIQAYICQAHSSDLDKYRLLTDREREVLQLCAEGLNSSEIAKQLSISARTAETHRTNLMHKLDIHSLRELTIYSRRRGLIS